MSRVFIPTNPHHLNRDTQELEPKFDFRPAEEFGELVFLLSPNANPVGRDNQSLVDDIHAGLESITKVDYLLLTGAPGIIAMTAAIASGYLDGKLNLLQWNGRHRKYAPIQIDVS
jgi:hypothetical protein